MALVAGLLYLSGCLSMLVLCIGMSQDMLNIQYMGPHSFHSPSRDFLLEWKRANTNDDDDDDVG